MRLKKKHKPTFHKANERKYGVGNLFNYFNFVLESVKDLIYVDNTIENDTDGTKKRIRDGFLHFFNGHGDINTNGEYEVKYIDDNIIGNTDLRVWTKTSGVSITKSSGVYKMVCNGLNGVEGVYATFPVTNQHRLYIRMKIKSVTGANKIGIGSSNVVVETGDIGDILSVTLPANSQWMWIEHEIKSSEDGNATVVIRGNDTPASLQRVELDIAELEIKTLHAKTVTTANIKTNGIHKVRDLLCTMKEVGEHANKVE